MAAPAPTPVELPAEVADLPAAELGSPVVVAATDTVTCATHTSPPSLIDNFSIADCQDF